MRRQSLAREGKGGVAQLPRRVGKLEDGGLVEGHGRVPPVSVSGLRRDPSSALDGPGG
jgi:hypothetical protein